MRASAILACVAMFCLLPGAVLSQTEGITEGGAHTALTAEQGYARLSAFLGSWDVVIEYDQSSVAPAGARAIGTQSFTQSLGGAFLEGQLSALIQEGEGRGGTEYSTKSLTKFVPGVGAYRQWWFDSNGTAQDRTGTFHPATKTLTYSHDGGGVETEETYRFTSRDQFLWTARERKGGTTDWRLVHRGTANRQQQ